MENPSVEISGLQTFPVTPPNGPTYEEFLSEYEGKYAEYVGGKVIENMTVSKTHNQLTNFLSAILQLFVESRGLGQIFGEPFQMRLVVGDEIRGREPDVFFVAKKNADRVTEKYLDGPADLVIEVVSPESFIRDTQEKFAEYEAAGVGEYWIVDPQKKSARFFALANDGKFETLIASPAGSIESRVIEGLLIDTAWFSGEKLPSLMSVVADWEK